MDAIDNTKVVKRFSCPLSYRGRFKPDWATTRCLPYVWMIWSSESSENEVLGDTFCVKALFENPALAWTYVVDLMKETVDDEDEYDIEFFEDLFSKSYKWDFFERNCSGSAANPKNLSFGVCCEKIQSDNRKAGESPQKKRKLCSNVVEKEIKWVWVTVIEDASKDWERETTVSYYPWKILEHVCLSEAELNECERHGSMKVKQEIGIGNEKVFKKTVTGKIFKIRG